MKNSEYQLPTATIYRPTPLCLCWVICFHFVFIRLKTGFLFTTNRTASCQSIPILRIWWKCWTFLVQSWVRQRMSSVFQISHSEIQPRNWMRFQFFQRCCGIKLWFHTNWIFILKITRKLIFDNLRVYIFQKVFFPPISKLYNFSERILQFLLPSKFNNFLSFGLHRRKKEKICWFFSFIIIFIIVWIAITIHSIIFCVPLNLFSFPLNMQLLGCYCILLNASYLSLLLSTGIFQSHTFLLPSSLPRLLLLL